MKSLFALPAALILVAAPALAGSPEPAVIEPVVVAVEASSSSSGASVMGLGLLIAILIAAD